MSYGIFKYPLNMVIAALRETGIDLPRGARVVSAALIDGEAVLYALVDHQQEARVRRRVAIVTTGEPIQPEFITWPCVGMLVHGGMPNTLGAGFGAYVQHVLVEPEINRGGPA